MNQPLRAREIPHQATASLALASAITAEKSFGFLAIPASWIFVFIVLSMAQDASLPCYWAAPSPLSHSSLENFASAGGAKSSH